MNEKKKNRKLILRSVCFLLALCKAVSALSFLMVGDQYSPERLLFHDFYQTEANIDTLFLGASHIMYGLDSAAYARETGETAFSLAASSAPVIGSYMSGGQGKIPFISM